MSLKRCLFLLVGNSYSVKFTENCQRILPGFIVGNQTSVFLIHYQGQTVIHPVKNDRFFREFRNQIILFEEGIRIELCRNQTLKQFLIVDQWQSLTSGVRNVFDLVVCNEIRIFDFVRIIRGFVNQRQATFTIEVFPGYRAFTSRIPITLIKNEEFPMEFALPVI
ncbi:hypothetical protein D3C71_1005000 [compost metagenome]